MNLANMTKEELELMSYEDITYALLKENKKSMNTPTIFKKICELLELTDEEYASKIGDYYTSLTIDKRFILLDNAEWDLRDNHAIEIVIDEDDDEEIEEIEEEIVPEEVEEIDEVEEDIIDDDLDDDMDGLEIVDGEEEESI